MSADKRNVEWEWYEGVRNCIFVKECLRFLKRLKGEGSTVFTEFEFCGFG